MKNYILAMDIGGTNSRIALFLADGQPRLIKKDKTPTKDVKSIETQIKSFLKKTGKTANRCCIGFAGPIAGKTATLTNAELTVNISKIKSAFGFEKAELINDFHAAARGIAYLEKKDLMPLNKGTLKNRVQMVVGPGTGLGKAYIIDGDVFPSEGGLTTLGIENIQDYTFLDYIRHIGIYPVYYEDLISGRGLVNIYDNLEIKKNIEVDMDTKKEIRKVHVKTAEIIINKSKNDVISKDTMQWFIKFYARFVRDSALHLIPSTIYLGGGISPAIESQLKSQFMKEFLRHRSCESLLKKISVNLIKNPDVGLIGAADQVMIG